MGCMGWDLTAWLLFGRIVQLLGALASAILHAYLTIVIHVDDLGLTKEMVVLQLLACIAVGYSIFAVVLQRPGRRAKTTSGMKGFVVCDVLMSAGLLGVINMLGHAGLPQHCAGLTRKGDIMGDEPYFSHYTTNGFSDEGPGQAGRLDHQCSFERAYFAIANALIFTYMLTITATVLSILSRSYTKNTKVNEMLDALERAEDISLKILDSPPSPLPELPRMHQPPPPSEGIITRNTSLRSNFTAATSIASSQTNPYRAHPAARRSVAAIPRRPLPASSPTSHSNPTVGFVPVPLEEDDPAEAALVADGMQHRPQPQFHHHPHPNHPQPHHQYHHPQHQQQNHQNFHPHHRQTHSSSSTSTSHPRIILPMLSEEETHHQALVSDGMRPSEPTLPPYHPGNRRMSGHGDDEDNEMRLSGYVKGQTRAQGMKDSGGY